MQNVFFQIAWSICEIWKATDFTIGKVPKIKEKNYTYLNLHLLGFFLFLEPFSKLLFLFGCWSLLYVPLWSYFRLCHHSLETLNAAHSKQVKQSKDTNITICIADQKGFDILHDEQGEEKCKLKSVLDTFGSKLFSILLEFVWFYNIWFWQEPHSLQTPLPLIVTTKCETF